MGRKGTVELRHHCRYAAREGAVAVLRPESKILGQIVDISLSGLAFRYIENESRANHDSRLMIFFAKEAFILDNLHFEVVTDQVIPNRTSFSSVIMRRCSVRFTHLDAEQKARLQEFIQRCTRVPFQAYGGVLEAGAAYMSAH